MRADLAAALLHNPKVLYLDEPTIGLDVLVKEKIRQAIKKINETYHTTIILTTHDIGDIEELCDRIIIIDCGHKIYDGNLEDLKHQFGDSRKISIEIKDRKQLDDSKLEQEFQHKEDVKWNIQNQFITFTVKNNALSVSEIIQGIMKYTEIVDMSIKETDLTDIVKMIYSKGEMDK